MTAVIALTGPADAAAVAAEVARRLSGAVIVIPYNQLLSEWPLKPGDPATLQRVTAQQIKLLVAGYVRAGYHVVLHGSFAGDEEAVGGILALMRTVPGVQTLRALVTEAPTPAAQAAAGGGSAAGPAVQVDLRQVDAARAAALIWEALPLEPAGD